jgi:peptidoglycan/xylan/chitin deacetylase (PgdA/CDA1 family)
MEPHREQHDDRRLPATIQVDLDGLDILLAHHGWPSRGERDGIFLSAMPRFLELFARWGVRATFFVVARDLEDPEKAEWVCRAVAEGHEVGNHTLSHPPSLSVLEERELEREIAAAEERIGDRLGLAPQGFRAPNFDVDDRTVCLLQRRGYRYDSSVLAMPYAPFFRWFKGRLTGTGQSPSYYLGRAIYGLAPLRPYRPAKEALWRRGHSAIMEVPITTMPFLRLPFHASFNLALRALGGGNALFRVGSAWARRRQLPLNYVFHVCELADTPPDGRLRHHWGLNLPLEERIAVADGVLARIAGLYRTVPTRQLVEELEGA